MCEPASVFSVTHGHRMVQVEPEILCLEQALRDADVAGLLPTFLRSLGRHQWRVLGRSGYLITVENAM